MKIVVLDGYAANPGDLSWDFLNKYGEVAVYDRTPTEALVVERAAGAGVVIINKTPITRAAVEALPEMKLIAVLATGYNVVDVAACTEHGVAVANVPGYSGASVAQQTFAFILEYCNRVAAHSASVLAGDWASCPDFSYMVAPLSELDGKTMGLIGYGDIGRRVARIAAAFGMRVLVHTAHPEKYPDAPVRFCSLDEMLPQCDFISLHAPMTPATAGLVNKEFLAKLKPGAFLVNNARGQEIAEADVAEALESGLLGGFGADVLSSEPPKADNPILHAKNVFVTPHIAWSPYEARVRLLGELDENVGAFLAGRRRNIVN
jgi:glycerate dehydrogenase